MVKVPAPARRLLADDSGHWTPWANDRWESLGHIHLYRIAQAVARGGRGLVIGAGEGFGAAMLAEVAESVIAVESDSEALLHARYNYRRPNLSFIHGEPQVVVRHVEEGSFDLLIALDFDQPYDVAAAVIEWAPKLLRPEGLMLLSTPTRRETDVPTESRKSKRAAAKGVDGEHLEQLLRERFVDVSCWTQTAASQITSSDLPDGEVVSRLVAKEKTLFAASLVPIVGILGPRLVAESGEANGTFVGAHPLSEWVDVVGDREAVTSELAAASPDSVELAASMVFDEPRLRRQVVAYDSALVRSVRDAREARQETELSRSDLEMAKIEATELRRELDESRSEAAELRQQLDGVLSSRSYRTARAIAAVRSSLPGR